MEITREQLIEKLQHIISVASGFPESEKAQMDLELARIALASLEAEAYGYVHKAAYEQAGSCGLSSDHEAYRDSPTHIAVYTVPPAPVSVPAGYRLQPISEYDAMCAAMLQGAEPVSNRDELTDGWVACSKRMPSPSTGVIVAAPWQSAPGGYAMKWATNCPGHPDADIDGWIIPGASWSPTHWQPLPAAPQQEA